MDDDLTPLRSLARMVGGWGYRPEPQSEGLAALDSVRQDPPDLGLVDIFMRGMDGFEVIAALRRISPATPVIAMSGDRIRGFQTEVLAMGRCVGARASLFKPVRPQRLREPIGDALGTAPDDG